MIESVGTHNGVITIENQKTGEHRTFKIETMAEDSPFAPGQRVLSILVGPNNEFNYESFAFVTKGVQPRVHVWKKHRTSEWAKYGPFLEQLHNMVKKHPFIQVKWAGRCIRCNRLLTSPQSIRDGIGPKCKEMI